METNKKPEQYKVEIIGSVKRGRGRLIIQSRPSPPVPYIIGEQEIGSYERRVFAYNGIYNNQI